MRNLIATVVAVFFSIFLSAQSSIKGYVYKDSNKNMVREGKEQGIPGVAVTNGKAVVLTDDKGKYELPLNGDAIISVIKPSGYNVPIDENKLPRYFYIHKPNGSPKLKFTGVSSTGELPESLDFALFPSEEREEFTALVFGDPQVYTLQQVEWFEKGIISEVEEIKNIPFGLSLGDLVGNNLNLFKPYIDAVKKTGIPWYNVLGNHDLNFDVESDELSDETFEAYFGPANYAFNYGKVHFIVLDDILYPDPRDGKGYWAGFRKDQLKFIENDLQYVPKDHLIVLAFHIPLTNSFRTKDRDRLFELLEDYPNTLSLSAHSHRQRQDFLYKEDGWKQETPHHHYNVGTTSGDWYSGKLDENGIPVATMRDGTPKGYAFINFEGNEYTIDYKVAGKPEDYRMEIFNPKVVAKGRKTQAGIFVNFFMGSEEDQIRYRIDGGEWKEMTYTEIPDPSYVKEVYEWDLADELMPGRRSSNPVNSKHLWRGSIPTNLRPGEHLIEVEVIDMFGRKFNETSTYRVENPL